MIAQKVGPEGVRGGRIFFGRKGGDDGSASGPKILEGALCWPGADQRGRDRQTEKILQRVTR